MLILGPVLSLVLMLALGPFVKTRLKGISLTDPMVKSSLSPPVLIQPSLASTQRFILKLVIGKIHTASDQFQRLLLADPPSDEGNLPHRAIDSFAGKNCYVFKVNKYSYRCIYVRHVLQHLSFQCLNWQNLCSTTNLQKYVSRALSKQSRDE